MKTGQQPNNLLLIEDDPSAARLFTERLGRFAPGEFHVTQARSMGAGLEEAADVRFQLAVLDLTLPDSSGLETCSRFTSAQPNMPFIVMTGVSDASLVEAIAHAGATAVFLKEDCAPAEMVNALRTAATPRQKSPPDLTRKIARARFRNAVIDSADGIVVLDELGSVILVSAGAESLLGKPAAELNGSSLGLELKHDVPVRAQLMREEPGHAAAHDSYGKPRDFDVCKLRIDEVEFWPFAHVWSNRPVTVCAMRDVSRQAEQETRQRNVVRIEEPLQVSSGIESICTELAVRLGGLIKFNRFEVSVWRDDLGQAQIVSELGLSTRGRELSALVHPERKPAEFQSWATGSSHGSSYPPTSVSIGYVSPGAYTDRDEEPLARCADMISAALAEARSRPVLTSSRKLPSRISDAAGAGFSDMPEAA